MKTVLIFSGGMDSTVLLYHLRADGHAVAALSIDYGQRHRCELSAARRLCAALGVEHREADLSGLAPLLEGSSLTDPTVAVPHGHYEEDSMKVTVVPNRNMLLLATAAAWAIARKADAVAYAAHSGDHAVYPDCREAFAEAMNRAIGLADWHAVELWRPFVGYTKADIARRGAELGVPWAETWSCYEGGDVHCGRCGTCIERREAFHLAGIDDPTPYADAAPSIAAMVAQNWRLS